MVHVSTGQHAPESRSLMMDDVTIDVIVAALRDVDAIEDYGQEGNYAAVELIDGVVMVTLDGSVYGWQPATAASLRAWYATWHTDGYTGTSLTT